MDILEAGVYKNKYMPSDIVNKILNGAVKYNPLTVYATTKYSPLPLNARILLRSMYYPDWNITALDLRNKEKDVLRDLISLSDYRKSNRMSAPEYATLRDVMFNTDKYINNNKYNVKEWGNKKFTGRQLKDLAYDLLSNGISFIDYENLGNVSAIDNRGMTYPKYSDKQINQMLNFKDDNKLQMAYKSMTNPLYAVRTAIGRADVTGKGKDALVRDVFDFQNIDTADFDMSNDYRNMHKFAEKKSNPLKSSIIIDRW